jgi:hypothetical protein
VPERAEFVLRLRGEDPGVDQRLQWRIHVRPLNSQLSCGGDCIQDRTAGDDVEKTPATRLTKDAGIFRESRRSVDIQDPGRKLVHEDPGTITGLGHIAGVSSNRDHRFAVSTLLARGEFAGLGWCPERSRGTSASCLTRFARPTTGYDLPSGAVQKPLLTRKKTKPPRCRSYARVSGVIVTITLVAPTGIDPVTFRFSVGFGGAAGARCSLLAA